MKFGITQLAREKPQRYGFTVATLNTRVNFINDNLDLLVHSYIRLPA